MHERALCFMQDLQRSSWQPSSPGSPSKAPQSVAAAAEEGRVARNISARVESAVLPSLGSMAARCNHLISQASVAFGMCLMPAAHHSTGAHHCCVEKAALVTALLEDDDVALGACAFRLHLLLKSPSSIK